MFVPSLDWLNKKEFCCDQQHAAPCLFVYGRLHEEKQGLEAQRLTKFCSAMKAVNGEIGPIYQKLTGGQGDAFLTFTEDALLLFTEGVHYHVRSVNSALDSCSMSKYKQASTCTAIY